MTRPSSSLATIVRPHALDAKHMLITIVVNSVLGLPLACATQRPFVPELVLDGVMAGSAGSAHESTASSTSLVVLQSLPVELHVARFLALGARV